MHGNLQVPKINRDMGIMMMMSKMILSAQTDT
jgi:hypothetical protein